MLITELKKVTPFLTKIFWLILTFIPLFILVLTVLSYGVNIPYLDQWDFLPIIEKSYSHSLTFSDFWNYDSGHRMVFPKIIMILLAQLTNWNVIFELLFIILLALGVFLLWWWQIKKTKLELKNNDQTFIWCLPVISLIIFSLNQWENWSWGWQITVLLNIFMSSLGIIMLSNLEGKYQRLFLALLFGAIAFLSFINGFFFWLIGLVILLIAYLNNKSNSRTMLIVWIVCSVIIIFFYLYKYQGLNISSWSVFTNPINFFSFIFTSLGAPIVGYNSVYAFFVGLFSLFIFVHLIWLLNKKHNIKLETLTPYLALGSYSLLSILMTGIGRAQFGGAFGQTSRYITNSSLIWVAIVILLYLYLINSKAILIKSFYFYFLLFLIPLIIINCAYGEFKFNAKYHYLAAAKDEFFSANNDEFLKFLYPQTDKIRGLTTILKNHNLSLFHNPDQQNKNPFEQIKNRVTNELIKNPYLDNVYFDIGNAYFQSKHYSEAEFCWQKTIAINPLYYRAHYNLVLLYLVTNNIKMAQQQIKILQNNEIQISPEILKAVNIN